MNNEIATGSAEIVVLGIFAADLVFQADRLPTIGETLLGRGFSIGSGGKGSNQAIAAARAGGKVGLITRIGADTFGDLARSVWQAEGIIADAISIDPAQATGAVFIFVSAATGDNAILVTPGAAGRISAADVAAAGSMIAGAKVFMTQLEQPVEAALAGLEAARQAGVVTIFNPAPANAVPDMIWRFCDWTTPNETEAAALSGVAVDSVDGALHAADALGRRGVRNVLITLGEKGALLRGEVGTALFPPLAGATVVDTTGAGDAFNAGFALALAEGRSAEDSIRFATAVAGLSVGRPGAAASMPARTEIEAALERIPSPIWMTRPEDDLIFSAGLIP
jgi:ribokinase